MKHIFAILSVCLVAVHGQSRPPKPPRFGARGTPVPMPDSMPTQSSPPASVSPPRPKGCSPGCGPTEICAELGASYCRNGVCSVCIKMSSIRFPASALAAMFSQSQPKPETQQVQTQPIVQMQPPANPFSRQNVRDQGNSEKEMSILEYAAKQRRLSAAKTHGKAKTSSKVNTKPPPPPPPAELINGYQVFQENSNTDSSSTAVKINNVQSASTSITQTAGSNAGQLDSQNVKYPIIVTVTDPTTAVEATSQRNAAPVDSPNGVVSPVQTKEESHLGHIDHDQMTKWYQQYQVFKQQHDSVNRANRTASTQQTSNTFDYATFQAFQKWLQTNQQQASVLDQTTVRPKLSPDVQPQITVVSQHPPAPIQPLMTGAPQNMPLPSAQVEQANTLDFNALQHQYNQWLVQQQNTAAVSATPVPVAVNPVTQPAPSVAQAPLQPQNPLTFASMQQQFLEWQQQQQQQKQQNQPNSATVQPQINTVVGSVPQPLPTGTQSQPQGQTGSFDFATFQSQYQQWQQEQARRGQAQTQTTEPTIDFAAFQRHMQEQQQQQQQQTQGQNAVTTQTDTVQGPNIPQNQQHSSQEIQYNVQPNPQMSQQQNTFSYMPQQPVNTYNDPFFFDFHAPQQNTFAPPQNNNLMDLMMFSSLGLGGGFFPF